MSISIALLRGINVGGRNVVPMKELAAILADLGLRDVKTYIQSGNVVFRTARPTAPDLAERISDSIEDARGFRPYVQILDRARLAAALTANPFADGDPRQVVIYFLDERPAACDAARLDALKNASESYAMGDRVFYLHAPDGIARSKLASAVEKELGVPATARNLRTATRLLEMAEQAAG